MVLITAIPRMKQARKSPLCVCAYFLVVGPDYVLRWADVIQLFAAV